MIQSPSLSLSLNTFSSRQLSPAQEPVSSQGSEQVDPQASAVASTSGKLHTTELNVLAHIQAHVSAGGQYVSGQQLQFTEGPDNKSYISAGEVNFDTRLLDSDPQAMLTKARIVRAAALAPYDISPHDQSAARSSDQLAVTANTMIQAEQEKQLNQYIDTPELGSLVNLAI